MSRIVGSIVGLSLSLLVLPGIAVAQYPSAQLMVGWLERFTALLNRKGFRIWGEYDSRCWLGWRPASDGPTTFQ